MPCTTWACFIIKEASTTRPFAFSERPIGASATILLQQARYAEAVEPLQQALSLQPDYGDAKLQLGVVSFKLGDLNQAATAFRSVLEGRPDHFFALTNLAATLLQLDSEQAITVARHAAQVAPDGQRARPLRILAKALALSSALMEPENGDAHYTERLERLPNVSFCYSRDRILGQRGEADLRHLRRQRIVYLCTQNLGSFYRSTTSYSRASWRPFPTASCGSLRAQLPRSPNDFASACWPPANKRASARSASSFTIA